MPAHLPTLTDTYDAALRRYERPAPSAAKAPLEVLHRAVDMINLDGDFFARILPVHAGGATLYVGKPSWREMTVVTLRTDDLVAAVDTGGEQAVAALIVEELARARACAERTAMVRYLCGKPPSGPAFQ